MARLLPLLLAFLPLGATAQPVEEYRPFVEPLRLMLSGCLEQSVDAEGAAACNELTSEACTAMGPGGVTDFGMEQCTGILTDLWDAEMGRYRAALLAEADEAGRERMEREQAAWLDWREAACRFAVVDVEGGSMTRYVGGFCHMDMTAERVAEFLEILGQPQGLLPLGPVAAP